MKTITIKSKHFQIYQQTLMYGNGCILSADFLSHPDMIEHSICLN